MATSGLLGLAFLLRWVLLGPGPGFPYLLFYPAIVLSGMLFDRGTSIFASIASGLLALYFFIEPLGSPSIARPQDLVSDVLFVGTAIFIGFLIESMHHVMQDFALASRQLSVANDNLAEANRGLAAANKELSRHHDERAMLLHEAAHRFRNDLQRLIAITQLQRTQAQGEEARSALAETQSRIAALARVTAKLDATLIPTDGGEVDSKVFIPELVEDLRESFIGIRPISVETEVQSVRLRLDHASILGLVLNEMFMNALKYAFPGDAAGRLLVSFRQHGEDLQLSVWDQGTGSAEGESSAAGSGMGIRLMRSLAARLGGHFEIMRQPEGGTRSAVSFSARPNQEAAA